MPRRPSRYTRTKPLPQRQGIDPVALLLPLAGESPQEAAAAQPPRPHETFGASTVLDYLVARFYPHSPEIFLARFKSAEVKDDDGADVAPTDPLKGQRIWYYRELGDEKPVPFDMPVLFEDEHILAVDKPHFLPTTPNGSYVLHTALAHLRVRENNPDLIPIHRLDRPTAGVVLFAKTVTARAPFQTMFQNRRVEKSYEAVAAPLSGLAVGQTLEVATRIDKEHSKLQVTQLSQEQALAAGKEINARSRISCLAVYDLPTGVLPASSDINPALPMPSGSLAHYRLHPVTGKTHQLRAHMLHLGAPIAGDTSYPELLPYADDEPALPLQLLARNITFTHPITRQETLIESQRQLALVAAAKL